MHLISATLSLCTLPVVAGPDGCANGGTFLPEMGLCDCLPEFSGEFCETGKLILQ